MRRSNFFILLCGLAACTAQAVVLPPPLPPGSSMVRAQGGLSEPEQQRAVRAHQHKSHIGGPRSVDDDGHGHAAAIPVVQPPAVRQFGNGPGDTNAISAILNPAPFAAPGTGEATGTARKVPAKTNSPRTAPRLQ